MHKKKLIDKIDKMFLESKGTKDVDFLANPSLSPKAASIKKSEKIFTKGESIPPEKKSSAPAKKAIGKIKEVIEKNHNFQELLLFRLGNEYYGINLIDVDTIRSIRKIIKVPMVPSYIKGIVNLKGTIVAIINIEELLNINAAREEKESLNRQLIISQNISFQIDEVVDVVKIKKSEFKKISSTDERLKIFFISEFINMENEIIKVINIKKLLTSEVIAGSLNPVNNLKYKKSHGLSILTLHFWYNIGL